MTRRIRQLLMLVAVVALMTLGGASAAFGAQGKSGAASCFQAASNGDVANSNYNTNTGSHGNFTGVPTHAWMNDQNAWHRCQAP